MRKIILSLLSLFVLTACSSTAPNQTSTSTKVPAQIQKVKLGVVMPLSGDAAAYGAEIQRVLDYELASVNQRAVEKGYQFELVYEDGKCNGSDAVTALQKLVDVDQVKFIIGGMCSSETLAMAPIAQEAQVVLLSEGSSNPDVENQGDFIFSLSYSDELVGKGIAQELNKFGQVAIVTEQNDFNVGLQKVVKANLNTTAKVVADETFPKGGTDFRNMLEKVANQKPDALFLNPNPGVTAANLLKQLAEIPALADVKLVSHYAYLADTSRADTGKVAEEMIVIDAPSLSSPALSTIMEAIKTQKGSLDTLGLYYTASTLDDLNIMTQAIEDQGLDPIKVKDALRTETFTGYIGKIYFGQSNFVQNIPAARFVVTAGKAVMQK